MADANGRVDFYTADPRGIIPIHDFHVPKSVRQLVRRRTFDVRFNTRFRDVMTACSQNRADGTWISPDMIDHYEQLHTLGHAHSVECFQQDKLVGGLYGVSLGAAFFGESMFHHVSNAAKVALVALVERLRQRQFELLDSQMLAPHLRVYGAIEIPATLYLDKLARALKSSRSFE